MPLTPLPCTLCVDNEITVKGSTNADCDGFSINLCTGSDHHEDTPLHFNPRFSQEEVVRNSHSGGDWGEEEKEGGFPFTQDSPFEVKIVVKEDHYEVSVNGSHFCNYAHRQPFESVRNVYIEGDTTAHVDFNQSVYPVPFAVSDGVEIIVIGVTPSSVERFSINLCSGTDFSDGTPLHFNPRFNDNEVVRNHFSDGWGDEEREGDFPFTHSAPYEVKFVVRDSHFQVFVNGSHFCNFNHRLDKESIRNVLIKEDAGVKNVQFVEKKPIYNPPIPFTTPINGGLAPGAKVVISGKPYSDPERFSVNLMCGPDFESSDLALHYDVRINYGEPQNYVVRTHRTGGDWGEEDREAPFFPFAADAPFYITIAVEHDSFQIYVNEQHHSTFDYRIQPVQSVDHMEIHGDVEISEIRLE